MELPVAPWVHADCALEGFREKWPDLKPPDKEDVHERHVQMGKHLIRAVETALA